VLYGVADAAELARKAGVSRQAAGAWFQRTSRPQGARRLRLLDVARKITSTIGEDLGVESSEEASASKEDRTMESSKEQLHALVSGMTRHEADLLWPVIRHMCEACRRATDGAAEQEEDLRAS
jgi:transcriptional regulator with XRE-family HTH domain